VLSPQSKNKLLSPEAGVVFEIQENEASPCSGNPKREAKLKQALSARFKS